MYHECKVSLGNCTKIKHYKCCAIKAAAIVFRTNPCLIPSGVSARPKARFGLFLAAGTVQTSGRVRGQPRRRGEACVHPTVDFSTSTSLRASEHPRGRGARSLLSVQCSPSLSHHWHEFCAFGAVNFQVFLLVILHLNEHFCFFHCNTKGFLSCFSRYLILR